MISIEHISRPLVIVLPKVLSANSYLQCLCSEPFLLRIKLNGQVLILLVL
jgi:hypothetical protein